MKKMSITCPLCGKDKEYEFTPKQLFAGHTRSQAFYEMPSYMRELFITGMCYDCQAKTIHQSVPGHDLGKQVGECYNCGAIVYENDVKKGRCAECFGPIALDEETYNKLYEEVIE